MNDDVNDWLFGGNGKAASFENVGDMVTGTITNVQLQQQRNMDSKEPMTWSDGSPRMQLVITLQTDARDGEGDEGLRTVYARGGTYEAASGTGTSMKVAIADALKRAGVREIKEGGQLTVAYTGDGKKTNRGFSAPKLYRAKYEPPVKSVAAADIWDEDI